jgi:hypothetical protein
MGLFNFTRLARNYDNEDIIAENIVMKFEKEYKENCEDFIINKGSYADSLEGINDMIITDFCQIQDNHISERIAREIMEKNDWDEDVMWNLADDIAFYLYDEEHYKYDKFIDNFYIDHLKDIQDIIHSYVNNENNL